MSEIWKRILNSFSPQQICWVCVGLLALMGTYGLRTFAKDSELKQVRVELLQQRLLDLRIRQCDAIRAQQSAQFFARQITEQSGKYRDLVHAPPDLPTCTEL
jgi:hypothetical protein